MIVLVGLPIAWLRINAALKEVNAARRSESQLKDSAIDLLQATFNNLTNGTSGAEIRRGVQRALELLHQSPTNGQIIRAESRFVRGASEL